MREAIYQNQFQEAEVLSGPVEMDETMFGGRKPGKRGWGAAGKTSFSVFIKGMVKY